jgi:hypothetical protein
MPRTGDLLIQQATLVPFNGVKAAFLPPPDAPSTAATDPALVRLLSPHRRTGGSGDRALCGSEIGTAILSYAEHGKLRAQTQVLRRNLVNSLSCASSPDKDAYLRCHVFRMHSGSWDRDERNGQAVLISQMMRDWQMNSDAGH